MLSRELGALADRNTTGTESGLFHEANLEQFFQVECRKITDAQ